MAPLGEREVLVEPPVSAAAAHLAAGDAEAALALLSPLVVEGASSVAARFVLGFAAWKTGRLDWALELARGCHEAAPMDGAIAETLASLYAQAGDLVECIYFGKLSTALGVDGGLAPLMPKEFPPFERAFLAIKEKPKLVKARFELARGRLDDALENARQHVALDSSDSDGRAFYAAALLRADRPCDALAELGRIERKAETNPAIASLYAHSLACAGDAAAARRWHDAAQSLAPDDPAIAAARIVDGIWLDDGPALAERGKDWAQRFAPRQKRANGPCRMARSSSPISFRHFSTAAIGRRSQRLPRRTSATERR